MDSWALEAYDHWPVPNCADPSPSARLVAMMRHQLGFLLLNPDVLNLAPSTGRYNCHGLVFASRRTNIHSPQLPVDVRQLLRRDRFAPLPDTAPAQVGDIAAYTEDDGEIGHTAFVSRVPVLGNVQRVFVWGAWGALGEFEHPIDLVPPAYEGCSIQYWRLSQ